MYIVIIFIFSLNDLRHRLRMKFPVTLNHSKQEYY